MVVQNRENQQDRCTPCIVVIPRALYLLVLYLYHWYRSDYIITFTVEGARGSITELPLGI